MRILKDKNNIIIKKISDFDLQQTLECGQCFRFYKQDEQDYVVVAYGRLLHIMEKDNNLVFLNKTIKEVENIWIPYFDLNRDYGKIKEFLLKSDETLEPAIKEKNGVRILNQEFVETLISFIISQNKQIPHIKHIVKTISENFGDYLGEVNGEKYYSFPNMKQLSNITEADFREMKTGFRAPYLSDAVKKLSTGIINEKEIRMLKEEDARKKLMEIKGVGEKVANCVMLFSLGYRQAFPIDVWIKRIMETLYFNGKDTSKEIIGKCAKELYGEYGGYAQQYLFCFGRDNKVGKNKNE